MSLSFICCLVLVQPRKMGDHSDMAEKMLTGMKSINANKQIRPLVPLDSCVCTFEVFYAISSIVSWLRTNEKY